MIEVQNITKKYNNFIAVDDISFKIEEGEVVGFLGPNGAGKSTTMSMITGFIEPTSGKIIVNGYDINQKSKQAKRQIGYMPENVPLYPELTVKEFVSYMADLKLVKGRDKKAEIDRVVKLTGLEEVKGKLIRSLSRGYKQRVSLAGALVGNPPILILDEPTVGLDPKQVIEIRELIKSFRKNHTVLISSHILPEINQICEKIIVIDKGEIVAVDTPKNLEKKTTDKTVLKVVVDDINNKFESLKDKIKEINQIKFVKENEDKSKEYLIESSSDVDIRRQLSSSCSEENIIILEMVVSENSLEDAFIKLVEDRKEYSQKEVEKMQYDAEIEQLREEEKKRKEEKENRKQAIKEEKARKKAEKEAKKESKKENSSDKEADSEKKDNEVNKNETSLEQKESEEEKKEKNSSDKGGNE